MVKRLRDLRRLASEDASSEPREASNMARR